MKHLFVLIALLLPFGIGIAQDESQSSEEIEIKTDSSNIEIKADKIIIQTQTTETTQTKSTKQPANGGAMGQSMENNEAVEEVDIIFPEFIVPSYEVVEQDGNTTIGINNGMTMFIPNIDEKTAADQWSDVMSEYKAGRKLSKESKVHKFSNGEVKAIDMLIPAINSGLIDVYTTFKTKDDGVIISTHYDLKDGTFLTQGDSPAKYEIAEGMLQNFGKNTNKATIEEELKGEQKSMKKIESEQKKLVAARGNLERKIEKNLATIERMKAEIIQAEEDIIINEQDQKDKIVEKRRQEKVLEYVTSKLNKFL